jgi:transposase
VPDETAATAVVADLTSAGLEAVIPARRGRKEPLHDTATSKEREQVERLVNRLKRMRRVATRYEKLLGVSLAMRHIACIVL